MPDVIIPGRKYSAEQVFELAERSINDHAASLAQHANMPILNAGCILLGALAIQIARTATPETTKAFLGELMVLIEADKDIAKVDAARARVTAAMNRVVAAGQ